MFLFCVFIFSLSFFSFSFYYVPCVRFHNKYIYIYIGPIQSRPVARSVRLGGGKWWKWRGSRLRADRGARIEAPRERSLYSTPKSEMISCEWWRHWREMNFSNLRPWSIYVICGCRLRFAHRKWRHFLRVITFHCDGFQTLLSASLYVSKRGAYWDRLCRDVVWSLVVTRVHCGQTVHPRPIVTMEH